MKCIVKAWGIFSALLISVFLIFINVAHVQAQPTTGGTVAIDLSDESIVEVKEDSLFGDSQDTNLVEGVEEVAGQGEIDLSEVVIDLPPADIGQEDLTNSEVEVVEGSEIDENSEVEEGEPAPLSYSDEDPVCVTIHTSDDLCLDGTTEAFDENGCSSCYKTVSDLYGNGPVCATSSSEDKACPDGSEETIDDQGCSSCFEEGIEAPAKDPICIKTKTTSGTCAEGEEEVFDENGCSSCYINLDPNTTQVLCETEEGVTELEQGKCHAGFLAEAGLSADVCALMFSETVEGVVDEVIEEVEELCLSYTVISNGEIADLADDPLAYLDALGLSDNEALNDLINPGELNPTMQEMLAYLDEIGMLNDLVGEEEAAEALEGMESGGELGSPPNDQIQNASKKPKKNWWPTIIGVILIVIGIILLFVPGGQLIGAGLIVSGAGMAASNTATNMGADPQTAAAIGAGVGALSGAGAGYAAQGAGGETTDATAEYDPAVYDPNSTLPEVGVQNSDGTVTAAAPVDPDYTDHAATVDMANTTVNETNADYVHSQYDLQEAQKNVDESYSSHINISENADPMDFINGSNDLENSQNKYSEALKNFQAKEKANEENKFAYENAQKKQQEAIDAQNLAKSLASQQSDLNEAYQNSIPSGPKVAAKPAQKTGILQGIKDKLSFGGSSDNKTAAQKVANTKLKKKTELAVGSLANGGTNVHQLTNLGEAVVGYVEANGSARVAATIDGGPAN